MTRKEDAMRRYWDGLDEMRKNSIDYQAQVKKTAAEALKREAEYAASKKAFMEGTEDDQG